MSKENNQEFWSESLEGLENNPVFAMSLGSKELFHSNFLAFIFMHNSAGNLRKWLYEKALGKVPDKTIEFDEYFREKSNFDLLFKIKDEETFILIENKFKSLPDSEQLKKYSEKLKKKVDTGTYLDEEQTRKRYATDRNTHCVILSPEITALKEAPHGWKICFYDDLIKEIRKIPLPLDFPKIADYYYDFTDAILHAMGEFIEKSRDSKTMIWQGSNEAYSDKIRKLRISDVFKKLWGQILLSKITLNDDKINAKTDYSHDSVCIDFKKNIDNEIICGVQLQDKHFNVYIELNQKNPNEDNIDSLLREILKEVFKSKNVKEKDRDKKRKCRHYGEKFLYHYVELDDEFSITDLSEKINAAFKCFIEKDKNRIFLK